MGSPAHVYKEIIEEIIRISKIPVEEEKEYTMEELEALILDFHKDNRDMLLYRAGIAVCSIMLYWAEECNDMFNAGLAAMYQIECWLGINEDDEDE